MAACSWCQPGIFSSDWVSEDEWESRCSTYTTPGLPESVETRLGSIVVPAWAEAPVRGTSFNPGRAEDIASSSSATGGFPSGTKTSTGQGPIDTDWADDGPWSGGDDCVGCHSGTGIDWDKVNLIVGVVLGVFLGLPFLGMIIGFIIHLVRQSNRKKIYGPLAEYYRNGGAPPPGLPMRGPPPVAGAYYPAAPYGQQQPYYPAGPSTVGSPSIALTTDGSRPQSFAQPGSPPQAYAVPGQAPAQQQVYQMPWSPVQQQPQPQFPQAQTPGGSSPPPAPPPGAYVHQPQPGVPMV
ncbi:hypothetical protein AURDEDRAFT_112481 [Auricularia subglabra TFB-10046 SS5]|nr:hypothetical protein AURDEDRAFT_112481 [Auricularia subglabra TFB-10046 SS5]